MKCRQCGKEFDQENRICPHCGFIHDLEHSDIPSELNHLSLRQIKKHLSRQHHFKKFKYVWLGLVLILVLSSFTVLYFQRNKTVTQIPNFHDDLIENKSSNATGNSFANLVNGGLLLQYGNDMYACDQKGITKISLSLDKKEVISNVPASYLNSSENGFYFISTTDNIICFYDVTNSTTTKLNIQASQLVSVGNFLYYLETSNNRSIYQLNKTTLESKKMTQSECVQFIINGDWLYFTTDSTLYQMPVLGGEIMKLSDQSYYHFTVDNQKVFYIDQVTGYIWSIKKDGTEKTLVVDGECNCFLSNDQYLFYSKTEGGIYKLNKETGEVSIITQDKANRLHIAGTWIYYLTATNEGRFVSIDENSETITPVDVIKDK